jgi:hypothetical protein
MNADHVAVAVIVCLALGFLVRHFRKTKQSDCCGNKIGGKRRG